MSWDTVFGGVAIVLSLIGGWVKLSSDNAKTRSMVDQHQDILAKRGDRMDDYERDLSNFKERVARDYVPYTHMQKLEEKVERGFADLRALLIDRLLK